MARVVLKQRQFEPTGKSLGQFEAKDLESFDLQFTESDKEEEEQDSKGGQSGPSSKVPDPNNPDSIKPQKKQQGGGSGEQPPMNPDAEKPQKSDEPQEKSEPNIPDKWDPYGENPDEKDPDMPDMPDFDDPENTEGGGGSSSPADSVPMGNDTENEDENSSDTQSDNGTGSDVDTPQSEQEGSNDNGDGQNASGGSDNSQSGQEGSDSDGEQSDGDSQSGNQGSESQEGESDNGGDSSNGQDQSGTNDQGNSAGGQSGESGDGGDTSGNSPSSQGGNNGGNGSQNDEGEDDEFDDYDDSDFGDDGESELEKASQEIDKKSTKAQKQNQIDPNSDGPTGGNDGKKGDNSSLRDRMKQLGQTDQDDARKRAEEARAAKELIGQAAKDRLNDNLTDEDLAEEDKLLNSCGAGNLTTMTNNANLKDWRSKMDQLFDKALGIDIITNPNLVNKKIEDAPPGREDETSEFANIVVILDQSGSMGAGVFKQIIIHIEALLKTRNMTKATFHIIPFETWDVREIANRYKKCKGSNFKQTMLSQFSGAYGGTRITNAFIFAAQKVKKPDVIIIMTDAQIGDVSAFEGSQVAKAYVKKHRDRIIWALAGRYDIDRMAQFDPNAKVKKRYIKFKKGGSEN